MRAPDKWEVEAERLAAEEAELVRVSQVELCRIWVAKCESPIEQIFMAYLCNWATGYFRHGLNVELAESNQALAKDSPPAPADNLVLIVPQQTIGKYRVDFLVVGKVGAAVSRVVIECDGHAFHERTKEQAAKDRSRDRALTLAGYKILRFTGSELYAEPRRCFEDFKSLVYGDLLPTYSTNNILKSA